MIQASSANAADFFNSLLEDFSMTARENLDLLDWSARRDVIRLMVRRIEIDDSQVEIVFRIPPPPSGGTGGDRKLKAAQHCTGERHAHAGAGLGIRA
jgi:site-specific DNA recombinase